MLSYKIFTSKFLIVGSKVVGFLPVLIEKPRQRRFEKKSYEKKKIKSFVILVSDMVC